MGRRCVSSMRGSSGTSASRGLRASRRPVPARRSRPNGGVSARRHPGGRRTRYGRRSRRAPGGRGPCRDGAGRRVAPSRSAGRRVARVRRFCRPATRIGQSAMRPSRGLSGRDRAPASPRTRNDEADARTRPAGRAAWFDRCARERTAASPQLGCENERRVHLHVARRSPRRRSVPDCLRGPSAGARLGRVRDRVRRRRRPGRRGNPRAAAFACQRPQARDRRRRGSSASCRRRRVVQRRWSLQRDPGAPRRRGRSPPRRTCPRLPSPLPHQRRGGGAARSGADDADRRRAAAASAKSRLRVQSAATSRSSR